MRRGGKGPSQAAASADRSAPGAAGGAAAADTGGSPDTAISVESQPVRPPGQAARLSGRRILGWTRRPALWLAGILSAGALGGYLLTSAAQAAGLPAKQGRPFHGTAAVGALFTVVKGKLVSHFCTASVVHSHAEDVLITAAHCVYNNAQPPPGSMAFVPGYHRGKAPHGVWVITAVYVDRAWRLHKNVNHDVAFLIAGRPGTHIERHTGAEDLGIREPAQRVQVIGYPDTINRPIICTARARVFPLDPRQLVFECDGFTTGTSGGPLLAQVSAKKGYSTVIGVIGGWEGGGNYSNVSYSPRFYANVRELYDEAAAGQPPPG